MASFWTSLGEFFWGCDVEFSLGSLCIQRAIIDVVNLLFVLSFCMFLLINSLSKNNNVYRGRNYSISFAVLVCCSLTGVAYFSAGIWKLIASTSSDGFNQLTWLVCIARAIIWISLTASLLVERPKSLKILVSVWWILYFLLVSVLNIEVLVEKRSISVLDAVPWSVNLLLFVCALKKFNSFISENMSNKDISEPLLAEGPRERTSEFNRSTFLRKLMFSWLNPLLSAGYSKPLVLDDIPCLVSEDQAAVANEKFSKAWDSLQKKDSTHTQNLVSRAIARVYFKEMVFGGILIFLKTLAVLIGPLLLYAFINYSNRDNRSQYEGLLLVGYLVILKSVESLSQRHFFFYSRRTGMRMRSGLMAAIYQKQLKLSSLGRQRHSAGEVVNYIAIDAYRMGEFPTWFHLGWCSLLQLILAIGVLYWIVGLGILPGLIPLFICGLLNVPYAKLLQKSQSEFMVAQDKRLRSTSEVLNNMKIIKLQSWEEKFRNLIESCRESEFKWLSQIQHQNAHITALYWLSPTMVSSVIFFGIAFLNSATLDAGTIFTILAALRGMAEPVRFLPEALSTLIQVKVSFDRINSFLVDDEIKSKDTRMNPELHGSPCCIKIRDAKFSWNPETNNPTLGEVNLKVNWGKKIAVCGQVGAGKSSLLYAILGEIMNISGTVELFGSIAYVGQSSWIQSGTVRDNILFGKPMEKTAYEKAIRVCALDKDIDGFRNGDLTEIGERGLNMSGGQKQRIQLARAVYNDADIYLLDDPFSAVDAHTAATLFNDCVMDTLKKKTVILVTHQVEFLSAVDNILVMEAGRVTQSGSYKDLLKEGTAFEQLVNAHRNALTVLDSLDENKTKSQMENMDCIDETKGSFLKNEDSEIDILRNCLPEVQLTEEEQKVIGNVGWKPLYDYILISKGSFFLCLSTLSQTLFVVLQAASSYWLAFGIRVPNISSVMLISVYTLISTTSAVFVFFRALFAAFFGLKASKAFFSGFTNSIFNAPMLFFDSTPIGRILTRASSDMSVLDFDIPFISSLVMASGIEMVAIICIIASVTWQVLIIAVPAAIATKYVQGFYQPTARELMRINGTTKAPIMSYAAETSLGAATIRAFGMGDMFFQNYLKLVDTDASTFFFSNATMEWLVLRIEAIQNLNIFTAALLIVLLPNGYVPPELVGLSLSYALTMTGTQVAMTRWYCNLSNYIISVERIKQFMHIPPEPPAIVEHKRPPSSWPSVGRIQFQDLKIRYRPNAPLILKGITCTLKEGTRVGIVGRTGSGKTTLITALFRLVEPDGGKILIDGLDICCIGLKDLRMKLSVIPQEPTLFKGSIRTNLDPLGLYSDDEIWKALEKCQLKSTISSLPNLLDSSVSDEGENWSLGQRQLFCLGRVLLKRNRILVLDEATASIDSATDAILQRIIREEFSDCTVITVAHRVPTVIDSDMVMVLSFGKLVEYDEPSKLMETNSSFSKLVAEYWSSCRSNSAQGFDDYHY